jgi:hypothetical protein
MLLTVLLALPLAASTANQKDFTKGADLVQQCSNWGIKNATNLQVDEGNQCLSYIEGFVDGKGPTYKFGCFVGFSYAEMISAYLEYMQKHPDYLQMSKRLGLDAALTVKFCPGWEERPAQK